MRTVEELRHIAINIATYEFKNRPAFEPALEEITGVVDTLIALARTEGAAQGLRMAQYWIDLNLRQNKHTISLPTDALLASVLILLDKGAK